MLGSEKYELIYEEKDELFDIGVGKARATGRVIVLGAYSKTSTEFRYIPASNPNAEWKIIIPRQKDHEYDVDHRNGLFYIRTNKGAKNFRVVTAPVQRSFRKELERIRRAPAGGKSRKRRYVRRPCRPFRVGKRLAAH